MYKVFVNDKPIVLTTIVSPETNFKNYLLDTVKVGKIIKELNKTSLKEVRLIGDKEHKLLKRFLKKLPNVVAAGGKVYNKNNEILFIYRNDKWDLPKGKIEKNESIAETAIREVWEETGVEGLKIIKEIDTTYHIFKRNGKYKIKITRWFEMYTDYDGPMCPEQGEGISEVKWLNRTDAMEALDNSYANIRALVL